MKRFLTAEDGRTMRPFHLVSPFIDFEDIYSEFHGEEHGLSQEEGIGFLQHYGFPTDVFDFSPSVENTRFFAAHGRDTEPLALIGVFPRAQLEAHFTVTDLSCHPFAQRPRRQLAYAGSPPPGIIDLKSPKCSSLVQSRWYVFRKSESDLEFARSHVTLAYPSEAEIAHFFGADFDEFFETHWTASRWTEEQRHLVHEKLSSIRGQLK